MFSNSLLGRAMAQPVSRLPVTAEARVRTRTSPRGIFGGQVALGQVFLRVLQFMFHLGDEQ
jgi:hypothetical protein